MYWSCYLDDKKFLSNSFSPTMASIADASKSRKGMYKDTKLSNGTAHRENSATALRRAKRRKQLTSKRLKVTKATNGEDGGQHFHGTGKITNEAVQAAVTQVLGSLRSSGSAVMLSGALRQLRKMLSEVHAHDPPISAVVSGGGVPLLIQYLTSSSEEQRLEATWCLSNIASGSHDEAQSVLSAVPYLSGFLTGNELALREQSLWALGNLAGDGPEFRAVLHANGVLGPAAHVYNTSSSVTTCTTAAWALSNLAKGRETPALPFLNCNILEKVLFSIATPHAVPSEELDGGAATRELLVESCWLLAHLTAKEMEAVHEILRKTNGSVVTLLCSKIVATDEEIAWPVLRCLGNIFSADGIPTECLDAALASPQLLSALRIFLACESPSPADNSESPYVVGPKAPLLGRPSCHRSLTKEAMWLVGNIMTGTPQQQKVADDQGLVRAVVDLFPQAPFDLRKEAAVALFNTIAHGRSTRTLMVFASPGMYETLVRMLEVPDQESVAVALRCIEIGCSVGLKMGFEEHGGMDALESIIYRGHSDELRATSSRLWDTYFEGEEEEEIPQSHHGGGGMFGSMNMAAPPNQNPAQSELPGAGRGRGRGMVLPAWATGFTSESFSF